MLGSYLQDAVTFQKHSERQLADLHTVLLPLTVSWAMSKAIAVSLRHNEQN